MLLALTPSHWLSLHGLLTLIGLLVYVVASHVLQQRRHPSAAIGWVFFMFLLPYAALPLYLARSLAYTRGGLARLLEWCRMPGDLVFIVFGVVPIVIVAVRGYRQGRRSTME